MSVKSFVYEHRVAYSDTDQAGIAHHSAFLRWVEQARVEFFRANGLTYQQLELDKNVAMPVVKANLRYSAPAFFDDVLQIETHIERISRAFIQFDYVIRRDITTLCTATITLCCIRMPERKVMSVPDWIVERFG